MIDKIVYGISSTATYVNEYRIKENYIELHICGGKYEAYCKIDKADYLFASSYHWSLMYVGKDGNKRLYVTTSLNRKAVKMSRLMLGINDKSLRVEHKDRDSLNFRRDNIYVVHKNEVKKQMPISKEQIALGVNSIYQKGRLTGYVVDYKQNDVKHVKYFGKREYGSVIEAQKEAVIFRNNLHEYLNR